MSLKRQIEHDQIEDSSNKREKLEEKEKSEEKKRQEINYHETMMKIYNENPNKKLRVYCDGIFDLFHIGHAKLLQQVKSLGPNVYLLVGVCGDEVTHRLKGKTVLTEQERYESVRHCKWVDYVIEDAPWVITQDFLDKYEIDYVAHDGDPYPSSDSEDVYKYVKEKGKFISTQRTEGISTSDIITRIVKDYDSYIRRNLKKGYTAKDLNIGYIKEKQLKLKDKFERAKKKMEERWSKNKLEIKNYWEDKVDAIFHPTESIRDFIQSFSRPGHLLEFQSSSRSPSPIDSYDSEVNSPNNESIDHDNESVYSNHSNNNNNNNNINGDSHDSSHNINSKNNKNNSSKSPHGSRASSPIPSVIRFESNKSQQNY